MSTAREIVVRLRANVSNYQQEMAAAQNSTQDVSAATDELSNKLGLIGAVAVGGAALVTKTYADFDQKMSNVAATGTDAKLSFDALRDAAIDAGAQTAFSAGEAADGIENLLKAGLSAEDILGGGLTGALDLAAAGELAVGDAAEIASSAMTQFGLKGSDVTHIADLLAAGAGKAQGDVSDLAGALNQSGLVANSFGLSIEETTGTLSAFASAGLLGSDSGTSFKTMLIALANPTEKSAGLMEELGINAYDASGAFVGTAELAGQLQTALGDMSTEQRNATLATIFGTDAIRSANVLYSEGKAGIEEWITAVDDQGYAADVAATRLDNLNGDLDALGGSFETLFIQSGKGLNDSLRGVVQMVTDMVNAFSGLNPVVLNSIALLVGGGGLVALGVAGLGKLTVSIAATKAAMTALGISTKTAALAVSAIGGVLAIAAVGLALWATNAAEAASRTATYGDTLTELGGITDDTSKVIANALAANQTNGFKSFFGVDSNSLIDDADRFGLSVQQLTGYIKGEKRATQEVTTALEEYRKRHDDGSYAQRTAADVTGNFIDALEGERDALTEAEKQQIQKTEAARESAEAEERLTGQVQAGADALAEQTALVEENYEAKMASSEGALSLRDAERDYEAAVEAATEAAAENGKTLDITTAAGRDNQEALDGLVERNNRTVTAMREMGATSEDLASVISDNRTDFIKLATSMGLSSDKANALADDLGLIPDVEPKVTVDTRAALIAVSTIDSRLTALARKDGYTITLNTLTNEVTRRSTVNVNAPVARATGGEVTGPGTATSDSIPALLSNGEHVLTADDVNDVGGQDAVYRMRQAIQAGALRFADGGAVADRSYAAPVYASPSAASAGASSSRTYAPVIQNYDRRLTATDVVQAIRRSELLAV